MKNPGVFSHKITQNQAIKQKNTISVNLKLAKKQCKSKKYQRDNNINHNEQSIYDQSLEFQIKEMNLKGLSLIKQNMQFKTQQALQKCRQVREKQLQNQIFILKEENCLLQSHFDSLNKKYKQKREQANRNFESYNDLKIQYQFLNQKYKEIQNKYKNKQQLIIESLTKQMNQKQNIYEESLKQSKNKILALQKKVQSLQLVITKSQQQYEMVKMLLSCQINNNKNKSYDNRNQLKLFKSQYNKQQEFINLLQKQLTIKNDQILRKNQNLQAMEKMVKQMVQKMTKLQMQNKKQLTKQRSVTKKAIESLNMNKKYAQIQMSKSRKKQKLYINSQKQLIGKIKQICKEHSELETNDKSGMKKTSDIKSLNTTLKTTNTGRQNVSPFVSKFITDEQCSLELSPIQIPQINIGTCKNAQKIKNKSSLTNCKSVPGMDIGLRRIQIPVGTNLDPYSRGTPCFEMENKNKNFRTVKVNG